MSGKSRALFGVAQHVAGQPNQRNDQVEAARLNRQRDDPAS